MLQGFLKSADDTKIYLERDKVTAWPYLDRVYSTEYPQLRRAMREIFSEIFQYSNPDSLNDIGCGNGWLTPVAKEYFPNVRVFDNDPRAIPHLNQIPDISVHELALNSKTTQIMRDADVLLFSHLFYYVPRSNWASIIESLTASRSRPNFLAFSLWSKDCEAFSIGCEESGTQLPCAEDLIEIIHKTGGELRLVKSVDAKHFLELRDMDTLKTFLALDDKTPRAPDVRIRENGGCLSFAAYRELDQLPAEVDCVIEQRDLILLAQYPVHANLH